MSKINELIERLCLLQGEVYNQMRAERKNVDSADCFCKKGGFWKSKVYNEEWFRNDGECVKFIEDTVRKALKERANIWPTYIESATSILENDGNCDGVRDCGSCPFQYLAIGELAGTCNNVEGCKEKLKEEANKFLDL